MYVRPPRMPGGEPLRLKYPMSWPTQEGLPVPSRKIQEEIQHKKYQSYLTPVDEITRWGEMAAQLCYGH